MPELPSLSISEVTRRAVFDELSADGVNWWGRLGEVDFLSRLFDLSALPSTDRRFEDAAADIEQHRARNPEDWPADWVFSDGRFNLVGCADADFLRFLVETVHPVVRPDASEARRLVGRFNEHLRADGFELYEASQASGRPQFAARPALHPALASAESGFPLDLDVLLASMFELLQRRGAKKEMKILAASRARGQQTGYDNWNGGTRSWSIRLAVELGLYSTLSDEDRTVAAKVLVETAKPFFEEFANDLLEAFLIVPQTVSREDWRAKAGQDLSSRPPTAASDGGESATEETGAASVGRDLASADAPPLLDMVADAEFVAVGTVHVDHLLYEFPPEQEMSVRAALHEHARAGHLVFKGPQRVELTASGLRDSRHGPQARALVERLLEYFRVRVAKERTGFLNFSSTELLAGGILGAPADVGLAVTSIRVFELGALRSVSSERVVEWTTPRDLPALRAVRTMEDALGRVERLGVARKGRPAALAPTLPLPAPPPRGALASGDCIGSYEIVGLLGEGGMGRVYRARHVRLEREAALKMLLLEDLDDQARADAAERMLREARAAARVSHPNIVTIHDVDVHEGVPYIAMELVRGVTLRAHVGNATASHEQKLGGSSRGNCLPVSFRGGA